MLPIYLAASAMIAAGACAESAWKPVICPEAERGAEGRFAVSLPLDGFEHGIGAWKAHAGQQNAKSSVSIAGDERHSGQSSLKVDYEFVAKKQYDYVALTMTNAVAARGLGLGLWMKKGEVPVHVNVRIADKSGEIHQVALSPPSDQGWGFIAAALDTEGSAWGGDGNKKLDYPCRLDSLIIDRNSTDFGGEGSLWIDDISLVLPKKARADLRIEAQEAAVGNLFLPGRKIRLRASALAGEIRWRAMDWRRVPFAEGSGGAAGTEITFSLPGQGYFLCRLSLWDGKEVVEERDFHGASLPETAPRNDFVGACVHFMRREAWPIEGVGILARLGITQVRDDFTWAIAEQTRGVIGLPGPQLEAIDHGIAAGVRWLGILCYSNPNYDGNGFPNSEDAIAAYARYCAGIARQLAGRVEWFEIWNEWSGGCGMHGRGGDHGPEAYSRLIKAAYPAIKAVAPNARVIGLGGEHSRHHLTEIKGMLGSGAAGAMDAWSVHPYRYPQHPEESDLVGELRNISDIAVASGGPTNGWITEIGWPTHAAARGVDEAVQARMVVRSMAIMQTSGFVDKVFWYDFKDDGLDRAYNENNFGLVRHQKFNFAPKPAAAALAFFSRMTAGARPASQKREGDGFFARYGLADGRTLLMAWSLKKDLDFSPPGAVDTVTDMMGNIVPFASKCRLGADPVYLVGRDL